jgi:hypothetical protein
LSRDCGAHEHGYCSSETEKCIDKPVIDTKIGDLLCAVSLSRGKVWQGHAARGWDVSLRIPGSLSESSRGDGKRMDRVGVFLVRPFSARLRDTDDPLRGLER